MTSKNSDKTGFLKPRTDRLMAELAARRNPTREVDVDRQLVEKIAERYEHHERCRRLLINDLGTFASRAGIEVTRDAIGDFLEVYSQGGFEFEELIPAYAVFLREISDEHS